jgi:hypothetical protein
MMGVRADDIVSAIGATDWPAAWDWITEWADGADPETVEVAARLLAVLEDECVAEHELGGQRQGELARDEDLAALKHWVLVWGKKRDELRGEQ